MEELIKTNDPVLVSFIEVILRDAGIDIMVADANMSVLEGSIGVLPRRVMVATDDFERARRLLAEANLGEWVKRDGA